MTWFGFDKIWLIDAGNNAGMFGLNGDFKMSEHVLHIPLK
jgi:hypothetical protein